MLFTDLRNNLFDELTKRLQGESGLDWGIKEGLFSEFEREVR